MLKSQNLKTISLSNLRDKIQRLHKKYQGLKKRLERSSNIEINHRRTFLRKMLGDFQFRKPIKEDNTKTSKKCTTKKENKSFEEYDDVIFTEKRTRKKVILQVDRFSCLKKKFKKTMFNCLWPNFGTNTYPCRSRK